MSPSHPRLTARLAPRRAIVGTTLAALALLLASAGYAEARGAPRWLTRVFRAVSGRAETTVAAAPGDTVVLFGPKTLALGSATSATFVERFAVSGLPTTTTVSAQSGYLLRATNGPNGLGAVSGGNITLNGAVVVTASQLAGLSAGASIVVPVQVAPSDTIVAALTGPGGSGVSVSVLAAPDPTFIVFGPKQYERVNGPPVTVVERFTVPAGGVAPSWLCVRNGELDGTRRNSAATVKLNGVAVVTQAELNQQVAGFKKQVTFLPAGQENVLEVQLEGAPGSRLTLCASATDAAAPTIAVTAPAAGLITNKTEVDAVGVVTDQTAVTITVNGAAATVAPATAGKTSFTAKVPLATEGTNTISIGAVDAAGNATDSVRTVIRDTEAPVVTLDALPDSALYRRDEVLTITGVIADRTAVTANVNGAQLVVDDATKRFTHDLTLTPGTNFIAITATDAAGNATSVVRQVTLDNVPPTLTLTAPAQGAVTKVATAKVVGSVVAQSAVTVTVNGVARPVGANGAFTADVALTEGSNTITVVATNAAGVTAEAARTVVLDTQAPAIAWSAPSDQAITKDVSVAAMGSITDASDVSVTLNGDAIALTTQGQTRSFHSALPLPQDGSATLTLVATDAAGNATTLSRSITRDATPPVITVIEPLAGASVSTSAVVVSGSVRDLTAATLAVNDSPLALAADGGFAGEVPLADGLNTIAFVATDAAGNQTTTIRSVTRSTSSAGYRLTVIDHGGVTFLRPLARDTVLPAGTVVPYSFARLPWRDSLYVVLDDTLGASSGSIVMDRDRQIEVVADTIYTSASLSVGAQQAAKLYTNLLNNADKQTPYRQLIERWVYGLGPLKANPDSLAHDDALAWHVTVDFLRDSAKFNAVNRALDGVKFRVWNLGATFPFITSGSLGVQISDSGTSRFVPRDDPLKNVLDASFRDFPKEKSHFLYVNGMSTEPISATRSLGLLKEVITSMPRFQQNITGIEHIYSPSGFQEMLDYDRQHPCLLDRKVTGAFSSVPVVPVIIAGISYAKCRGERFVKSVTTHDLVSAIVARERIIWNVPPTQKEVDLIARHVTTHRTGSTEHTILIGHSRGNLLIAGAMMLLPTPQYENHEIQVAPACVGTIALASPAPRNTYLVDDPYKLGYTIEGDIIQATVTSGWEELPTLATVEAMNTLDPLKQASLRVALHRINETYLTDSTSVRRLRELLKQVNHECLEGELIATPRDVNALVGTQFDITFTLKNQNGRQLYGHPISGGSSALAELIVPPAKWYSPFKYVARSPNEQPSTLGFMARNANETVTLTVPLATISGVNLVEKDTSWWTVWSASNGGLADAPEAIYPSQKWDGSEVCPTELVRTVAGQGPSGDVWTDWRMSCSRSYIPSGGRVDDPQVAAQVNRIQYAFQVNGVLGAWGAGPSCPGLMRCVQGVKARAISNDERVVAYSGLVGVTQVIVTNRLPQVPAVADEPTGRPARTKPVHRAARPPKETE